MSAGRLARSARTEALGGMARQLSVGDGAAALSAEAAAFLRRCVEASDQQSDAAAWEALTCENEALRGRVADLSGALKARDMEIAALRERCRGLMRAIEQQDETIAKIYAAAASADVRVLHEQQKRQENGASLVKRRSVSMAETQTSRTGAHVGAAPPPLPVSKLSTSRIGGNILSEAVERILHPASRSAATHQKPSPQPQQMSLFDDDVSTEDSSPSSCSSTLSSNSSSTRSFERRESCASEEDFVKSAGFLRKPSRRSSGRLSVSDFGLLDVEDDDTGEEEDNQQEEQLVVRSMGEGEAFPDRRSSKLERSKSEDAIRKRSRNAVSSSQRNLFADIDAAKVAKSKASNLSTNNQKDEEGEQEMTYAEFLERLKLPASRDLLDTIRMFLASIIGPRGDGKPPRSTDFVDYDFCGTHEFRRRCTYFFQSIEELLQNHPLWHHASEATLSKARDGVEKYVMDKLQDVAMNQLDECAQWKQEDERLYRRMQLLSFITPDMLDIKPCMRNEVVWSMAEDELRRINSYKSPGDKINCIVRCCSIIFSVLNLTRGESGSRPGADDFLPVFIYIVLQSKIPRLYSNCEYIAAYRNPNDLMSKAGYCFVNLRSALEFLSVVDSSMLSISEDEFQRLYTIEELKLSSTKARE